MTNQDQPTRRVLTWAAWIGGTLAVLGALSLLLASLGAVNDSTRAASELAEIRTFATEVAVAAQQAHVLGDVESLNSTIIAAETRGSEITAFVEEVLGSSEGERLLDEMRVTWFAGADAARRYVDGGASFTEVAARAAETGLRVNVLLDAVAAQREAQTARLRTGLQIAMGLVVAVLILVVLALVRVQRRAAVARVRAWMSEQRAQEREQHDALTGLLNLDQLISDRDVSASSPNVATVQPRAAIVIDLDRFRRVNDALGVQAGDAVLATVARRIVGIVGSGALSRRGTEFMALLTACDLDCALEHASAISAALAESFHSAGRSLWLTASIGVVSSDDPEPFAQMLVRASAAASHAKAAGSDRVHVCDDACAREGETQLAMAAELRDAVERGALALHYQPQVDLASNRIVAAEALLRWESPGHGYVSPAVFVPMLEESNQIVHVGEWVLETACRQAQLWATEGRPIRIAVNVSARQLTAEFPEVVARILSECELSPERLELEVTESLDFEIGGQGLETLRELEAMGVAIALDDFGTGHSSLKRLSDLPVRTVKIDRSFVSGLTTETTDAAIVVGVIAVAHQLGHLVVAEGVETPEQLSALRELGCDIVQGFLLGRPVPAAQFPDEATEVPVRAA